MNTASTVSDSSRDVQAFAAMMGEKLEEPWFEELPPSTRRSSAPPSSGTIRVGEFLGDPLADAWLR